MKIKVNIQSIVVIMLVALLFAGCGGSSGGVEDNQAGSDINVVTFERTLQIRDSDCASSAQETSDEGFIITGIVRYGFSQDAYLAKTDSYGNKIWYRTLANPGSSSGSAVEETSDGGFIITGIAGRYDYKTGHVFLIKTDASGYTIWSKYFWSSNSTRVGGRSVQETSDGGFIVAAQTSNETPDYSNIYLIKTDAEGNELWAKTYGGAAGETAREVIETSDGSIVVVGSTYSYGAGGHDIYLMKTDADGNEIWSNTYGGSSHEYGNAVQETLDGGLIITGSTSVNITNGPSASYLIKTDVNGIEIWSNTFSSYSVGQSVRVTSDGGFILVGSVSTNNSLDVALMKTDQYGNETWTKTFGGNSQDFATAVEETSDGGFMIAGKTSSYEVGGGTYLIKTDELGRVQ